MFKTNQDVTKCRQVVRKMHQTTLAENVVHQAGTSEKRPSLDGNYKKLGKSGGKSSLQKPLDSVGALARFRLLERATREALEGENICSL